MNKGARRMNNHARYRVLEKPKLVWTYYPGCRLTGLFAVLRGIIFKPRCMCYLGDRDIPFSSTSFIMFAFFSVEY